MLAFPKGSFPNEVVMIHPSNDVAIAAVLEQIGYDVTQEWNYVPSKHRDMQGVVAVGYMVVGEYSRKPEHRHFLDANDRIILAGQQDASLGKELAGMAGRRNTYKNNDETENTRKKPNDPRYYTDEQLLDMGYTEGDEEGEDPDSALYIEADWEETLRAIKLLEQIRDDVRGV